MGAEDDSVEAAALARRERLRALKAAQELLSTPDDSDAANQQTQNQPHKERQQGEEEEEEEENEQGEGEEEKKEEEDNVSVKFRNYLPHDKQLQDGKVAPPVLPKFEDPVLSAPPPEDKKEDPFLNIAPKKPNWDLSREVQKKLDKLEKRTQKAMLILMEREEAKRKSVEDGEDRTENGGDD